MSKNWEHAAGILWPVLVDAAERRHHPKYSDLAPLINTNALSVRYALELIQAYCMDCALPPLSAIVVSKSSGVPGGGFIAWDIDDIDTAYTAVFKFSWSSTPNPFGGFSEADTITSLSDELVENPEKAGEVYAKVKVRGIAQRVFRQVLLKAYQGKCAICGLGFKDALEAAHIIPWAKATSYERMSPRNGILLCSNHHRLFDKGIIEITTDFKIKHIEKSHRYSQADISCTRLYQDKLLSVPKSLDLRPSFELINRRNEMYREG